MIKGNGSFNFGNYEMRKALKVFLYTMIPALGTLIIATVNSVEFPSEWLFVGPLINTLVVAIVDYVKDNQEKTI